MANSSEQTSLSLEDIESQLSSLTLLKSQKLAELEAKKSKKDKKKAKSGKLDVKVPKGTKDWFGRDMAIRERMFCIISTVFKRHGGIELDTPVFELKEVLTGKYGEDSKLIYDLQDQGGELCSLRYDLTVPFARWLAMDNISSVKRYHLAKVYRRDQPAVQKGRMREFFQCDFDIAGDYDPMIPDAEIIRIINEVFTQLEIGEFTIKINHRKILDGVFEVCGVPSEKVRSISSAVDKLDKLPWEQVKSEMVEMKGLEEGVADRIYGYVRLNGGRELLEKLKADTNLQGNISCQQGLSDMMLLFNYIEALNAAKNVSFDLSLARGLDYYTSLIFEVITSASAPPPPPSTVITSNTSSKKKKPENPDEDISESVGVGSICGGGRYDDLVGRFAGETRQIPCVGMSVGIERVFAILKAKHAENTVRASDTQVFVMAMGNVSVEARLAIMTELWDAGISAEFPYKVKPAHLSKQFKLAEKSEADVGIFVGEEELGNGNVTIKQLGLGDTDDGEIVKRANMVEYIKHLLQNLKERPR